MRYYEQERDRIDLFREEYEFLSNFYPAKIMMEVSATATLRQHIRHRNVRIHKNDRNSLNCMAIRQKSLGDPCRRA